MIKYCDVHIHLADLFKYETKLPCDALFLSSASDIDEFIFQEELAKLNNQSEKKISLSFGIHPQDIKTLTDKNRLNGKISFLQELVNKKRIACIGEVGFDFYEEKYTLLKKEQIEVFNTQLDIAIENQLPLVIHARKAMPLLFEYSKKLATLPAVVFHSWSGSSTEAKSFLSRGINAYFSLGKSLLQGNKRAIATAKEISASFLLTETDAPYQTLKNQFFTSAFEIADVVKEIAKIKETTECFVKKSVVQNFFKLILATQS